MKIDWLYFAPALLLLLPPLPLRGAIKSGRRPDYSVALGSMLAAWQNKADLSRAALGAYLLSHHAVLGESGTGNLNARGLVLISAVAGVGLLLQTVRPTRGVQIIAPVFYLSGMMITVSDFATGMFAVFAGWMFAIGSGKIAGQMPVTVLAMAGAGYLFQGPNLGIILSCMLAALPLAVAFMFRLPLLYVAKPAFTAEPVLPTRSESGPTSAPPPPRS